MTPTYIATFRHLLDWTCHYIINIDLHEINYIIGHYYNEHCREQKMPLLNHVSR